ncbi:MAG: cyclodeaminase/cyclohydrolase family protein [Vicinamibacterales bacterium]
MTTFASRSFTDLLDLLAAPTPTPGGGVAAALSGALGAAVGQMVASLPRTRHGTPEEHQRLMTAAATLGGLRATLLALADADAQAVKQLVTASRLPKTTPDERQAWQAALAAAAREATRVPLETVSTAADALEALVAVAAGGAPVAAADVFAAITLLSGAADSAAATVRTNLTASRDDGYVRETSAALTLTLDRVERAVHDALGALQA